MVMVAGKSAYSQEIPSKLQAAIFLKVLSYDSSISAKKGNKITIFIVTDRKTITKKQSLVSGFEMLVGRRIGSKTISVKSIDATEATSVSPNDSILYLDAASAAETVTAILSVAVAKKIATLGGSEALAKKGVAVGLGVGADGKPKIIINLNASKKQGMKLSSRVLGLAKLVQ